MQPGLCLAKKKQTQNKQIIIMFTAWCCCLELPDYNDQVILKLYYTSSKLNYYNIKTPLCQI